MRMIDGSLGIIGLLIGAGLGASRPAEQAYKKAEQPGLEPYTPTKIEWMRVSLNAHMKTWHQAGAGTFLIAFGGSGPDTIELRVVHGPQVDRKYMRLMIDEARYSAEQFARQLGLEKHVRIEEKIKMME